MKRSKKKLYRLITKALRRQGDLADYWVVKNAQRFRKNKG